MLLYIPTYYFYLDIKQCLGNSMMLMFAFLLVREGCRLLSWSSEKIVLSFMVDI